MKRLWLGVLGVGVMAAFSTAARAQDFEPKLIRRFDGSEEKGRIGGLEAIGDQNGDGVSDFLIWYRDSPFSSSLAMSELYYGGNVIDSVPAITFKSVIPYRSIGDVNGDGLIDLVGEAVTDSGRIGVFFYGGNLDTTYDMLIPSSTGYLGGTIGDVNSDGYEDFTGRAGQVYLGGAEPDFEPDWQSPEFIHNPHSSDSRYPGGVDINADGYDDFLIWKTRPDTVYLFLGGEELPQEPAYRFTDNTLVGWLSEDLNGDNYDDLIGVRDYYSWGVIFGGEDIEPEYDLILEGSGIFESCEEAKSTGDVNGDGYADVLANASWPNQEIYVFLGGEDMDGEYDFYINGLAEGLNHGVFPYAGAGDLFYCGDVTGDGINEFAFEGWDETFWPYGSIWIMTTDVDYGAVNENQEPVVNGFFVSPAFPNPFNDRASFQVELPVSSDLSVSVYGADGRMLFGGVNMPKLSPGRHTVPLRLCSIPSGQYFAQIVTSSGVIWQPLCKIK